MIPGGHHIVQWVEPVLCMNELVCVSGWWSDKWASNVGWCCNGKSFWARARMYVEHFGGRLVVTTGIFIWASTKKLRFGTKVDEEKEMVDARKPPRDILQKQTKQSMGEKISIWFYLCFNLIAFSLLPSSRPCSMRIIKKCTISTIHKDC